MGLVGVSEVTKCIPPDERLLGCEIDLPKAGDGSRVYGITAHGWAIGRNEPVRQVEFVSRGEVIHTTDVTISRPDVAAAYPGAVGADVSGFQTAFGLLGTPVNFDILVRAKLTGGGVAPIGSIRGNRASVPVPPRNGLRPLLLTTLGRSGSTWVMRLLGQHHQILTYRPFQYEPRVCSYWARIAIALSAPSSYLQQVTVTNLADRWWLGDGNQENVRPLIDPSLDEWLGSTAVVEIAGFICDRVEAFYRAASDVDRKPEPLFFGEKVQPNTVPELIGELEPRAREVCLVRDFRDVLTSILAYNAKRDFAAFDRDKSANDKEYVENKIRPDAEKLLEGWRSRGSYLLKYDDLIIYQHETLARLLDHLGLDSASSVVEAMISNASQETEAMRYHRTSADPRSSLGRWQRELNPALKAVCVGALSDVLTDFGYDPCL